MKLVHSIQLNCMMPLDDFSCDKTRREERHADITVFTPFRSEGLQSRDGRLGVYTAFLFV